MDGAAIRFLPQRYEPCVPLARLTRHPANPNDGDLGLLCTLLDANGFAGAVMAQESTGILIDGGTRLDAAEQLGLPGLPVIWVDCDDDTRDRLLAEWNESGRRGINDETRLIALLSGLAVTGRGLEGCAFDGEDLDTMISHLNHGQGPPPPSGPEPAWTVTVHLAGEDDAAAFFGLIGHPRAATLWWAPAPA